MKNDRKKRWIAAILMSLSLALTACGGNGTKGTTEAAGTTGESGTEDDGTEAAGTEGGSEAGTEAGSGAETEAEKVEKEEYDALALVDLGEYKGIEVAKADIEVSADDLESELDYSLSQYATTKEVKDRAVKVGDTINLDYKGMKDGVAFDGGTAQGATLEIGSGQFIDGFEDGLVGVMPGKQVSLDLTFPDPYKNNPDLAGQPVVFEVTVNYIAEEETPELTDEFAKEHSDYQTAEEYKEGLRETMESQNKKNVVMDQLMAQAKFGELPQNLIDYYTQEAKGQMTYQAAMYGVSYEEILSYYGYTEESFLEEASVNAQENAKQDVLLTAIVADAGIALGDGEYQEQLAKLAEGYGMPEDTVEQNIGKELLTENFLWNKAIEYVADNAVVK